MNRIKDITGMTFWKLTAVSPTGETSKNGLKLWNFVCVCGGTKVAAGSDVKRGSVKSCGCLINEQKRNAAKSKEHPYSRRNMYRERKSWENMMARCYTNSCKSFSNYGGKGITVCDTWRQSFQAFAEDMGARPEGMTLDRINGSLGYTKENCRWSTYKEQSNNIRTNRIITVGEKSMSVAQWAEAQGINPCIVYTRLYNGWADHDAVLLPKGSHKPIYK